MDKRARGLSKSRILTGLQCPKALYLQVHSPSLAAPVSSGQQAIFDQGNVVGIEARKRFPGGIEITAAHNESDLAVSQTLAAVGSSAPAIYEATFIHDGVVCKVDILSKRKDGSGWEIVEVKSSTGVKEFHHMDVAIQSYVLRGAGVSVQQCSIMHLNNECVWPDATNLFVLSDVSEDVEKISSTVESTVQRLRDDLLKPEAPVQDIGPHCSSPYSCNFKSHCWQKIPSPSIFEIPKFWSKVWDLYANGIVKVDDPGLEEFVGTRAHQVQAIRSGVRWVDYDPIKQRVAAWKWPMYFLDFETIGYAIPRIDGTRPYQQVPFQFSCHVQRSQGSEIEQVEYLHHDHSDPRAAVAAALVSAIGPTGSIVAYNKAFEAGCIRDLATRFPEYSEDLQSMADRLVDPLPIIREAVYDPQFKGSFSLKAVAPALLGQKASYQNLVVADGGAAQQAFVKMIDISTSDDERAAFRQALLVYCRQDTQVMVDLVHWLFDAAK